MLDRTQASIRKNPRFAELVRKRSRFAWTLSAIMLAIYFAFILIIAFAPQVFGLRLGADTVTTLGFPIGIAVIVTAILLTGLYVWRANTEFDRLTREIIKEAK